MVLTGSRPKKLGAQCGQKWFCCSFAPAVYTKKKKKVYLNISISDNDQKVELANTKYMFWCYIQTFSHWRLEILVWLHETRTAEIGLWWLRDYQQWFAWCIHTKALRVKRHTGDARVLTHHAVVGNCKQKVIWSRSKCEAQATSAKNKHLENYHSPGNWWLFQSSCSLFFIEFKGNCDLYLSLITD